MASVLAEFDQEEYEEMIRRESKEEGIREGICIFINDKLEDGIPVERIIEKLIKNYKIDKEKALEYIRQCENEMNHIK